MIVILIDQLQTKNESMKHFVFLQVWKLIYNALFEKGVWKVYFLTPILKF